LYGVTSVAHGMVLIGCDDDPVAATAEGKHFQISLIADNVRCL